MGSEMCIRDRVAFREAGPALRVTDAWLRSGQLHLDIAYLMNEATLEYLEDLRRLNSSAPKKQS